MSLPSKDELQRDLRRRSGHSDSDVSFNQETSDSEIEVVAGPSPKRRQTPTSNPSDEDDPHHLNRAFLATSCSRRPPSCSPQRKLRGVDWHTPATKNTCVLDLFLTMLSLMVQKKLYYEGFEEAFYYKLEDLFNMECPMDQNTDTDQYNRQHSAYFVEENLRHLIFIARSHILGDKEKGLERLAKFTFLSLAFPSVYLKNQGLLYPAVALVEKEQ
jgi:hypothetical protein